jgi:hypothetical protein
MKKHIDTPRGRYTYTFRPLFLGIKPIDKTIAKENLLLIKHILDTHRLLFLLSFGTLLGAVREKDFITHDEDCDLIMMKKDMDTFLGLLFQFREEGFEVVRYESRGFLSIMRKGEYTDFYFYQDYPEDNRYMYCCRDLYFKDELLQPSEIKFLETTFLAPRQPERYLRFNYGENWQQPVASVNFHQSRVSLLKNYVAQYAKAILPESLVRHMQESSDRKFIDKWVQKANHF